MSNRWFTLRQLIVSNKHLRIIRNDFKDHYNSSKYQIRHVKDKLINYPDLRNSKEPEILLTQDEISGKYEYIKNKNLSLIDLHPFADNAPLVSIIILNKNGFIQLKRLFKDFEETIQVNLIGSYLMCRNVVPLMIKNSWGRIINISSIAG